MSLNCVLVEQPPQALKTSAKLQPMPRMTTTHTYKLHQKMLTKLTQVRQQVWCTGTLSVLGPPSRVPGITTPQLRRSLAPCLMRVDTLRCNLSSRSCTVVQPLQHTHPKGTVWPDLKLALPAWWPLPKTTSSPEHMQRVQGSATSEAQSSSCSSSWSRARVHRAPVRSPLKARTISQLGSLEH